MNSYRPQIRPTQMAIPISRGFTLAELLVVLLIIGVLVGGSVVAFGNRKDKAQMLQGAKQLASALQWAASESRLHHAAYRVVLDDTVKHFRIERAIGYPAAGTESSEVFQPLAGRPGQWIELPTAVQTIQLVDDAGNFLLTPSLFEFRAEHAGFSGIIELVGKQESVLIEVLQGSVRIYEKQVVPNS